MLWRTLAVIGIIAGVLTMAIPSWAPAKAPYYASAVQLMSGDQNFCSGVHLGDGFVLTAAHCMQRKAESVETRDGHKFANVEVLWAHESYDIALLSADMAGHPHSNLVCRVPPIGEAVTIVGSPANMRFSRARGEVMSGYVNRDRFGVGQWKWLATIMVNITAGPGNSGSPIYDASGYVVGILVGGYSRGFEPPNAVVPAKDICKLFGRAA